MPRAPPASGGGRGRGATQDGGRGRGRGRGRGGGRGRGRGWQAGSTADDEGYSPPRGGRHGKSRDGADEEDDDEEEGGAGDGDEEEEEEEASPDLTRGRAAGGPGRARRDAPGTTRRNVFQAPPSRRDAHGVEQLTPRGHFIQTPAGGAASNRQRGSVVVPEEYNEYSLAYLRGTVAGKRGVEPSPPEGAGEAAYLAAYATAFNSGVEPRSVYGSGGSARSSDGAGFVTPSSFASGGMEAGVDLYYENNGAVTKYVTDFVRGRVSSNDMEYSMYIVGGQCKALAFAAQAAALRRHKPALLLDDDLAEQVRSHCAPRPATP